VVAGDVEHVAAAVIDESRDLAPNTCAGSADADWDLSRAAADRNQRPSVPIPRLLADELACKTAGKAPGDLVLTAPEGGVLRKHQRPRALL
jgi:hypothetical protein